MSESTQSKAAKPQNYILYRKAALMYQPGYTYTHGATPTPPEPVISAPAGEVIATQLLYGLSDITAPNGYDYALDVEGKYPIGSIFVSAVSDGKQA